jgi:predicted ATPase/DNA-binding CsgD family transcriptional regulator/transcriptional regulator with XRE-family HTH domain
MANHSPEPFGALLKRYRTAALLTQEQLAARARLSPDAIRALERGKRRTPRPDSARLLADALALTGAEREELLAAAVPSKTATLASQEIMPSLAARLGIAQPTPLLGRVSELEMIRQRLVGDPGTPGMEGRGNQGREQVRLLTLTGPAGVGKTRLALAAAIQLADHFPDGVVLVDLTPIRDPPLVLPTIARALGLAETGGQPLPERLRDALRERSALLVLDNFEQVLPAAGALAELLGACPRLTLLVTSRAPLRLRWEWTLRVSPLPVPDLTAPLPPLEVLVEIPAVALFLERARRADFALTAAQAPLVAQLASELDGLPLALELAAANLDALPLPTIVRRLGDRLRLLRWEALDLPERQQSLEAAIGWSYDLLSVPERRLFRCLGVFSGWVSPAATAAVVSAVATGEDDDDRARDHGHTLARLASLAEKSLVLPARRREYEGDGAEEDGTTEAQNGVDPEPAFAMLETVREYAWEQLERLGELEAGRRAHAYYFLALAEQADPQLRGPNQRAWYFRLEREHDNLRAALRWLLEQDTTAERAAALRLAAAMGWFWAIRGYPTEGSRWLEEALARAPAGSAEEENGLAVRTRALLEAGAALVLQGNFARAGALQEEALTLARQRQDPAATAQALTYLGTRAVYAGEVVEGAQLLREAQARWETLGDAFFLGLTLNFLGTAALAQGDLAEAAALKAAALERLDAAGGVGFAGTAHLALAAISGQRGDLPQAVRHVRAGIEASLVLRDRRLLSSGARAALALVGDHGDPVRCMRLLGASDVLSQVTGGAVVGQHEPAYGAVAGLRERLEQGAAYREGRSLSFGDVVTLARSLLDDVAQIRAHIAPPRSVSDGAQEPQQRPARPDRSPLSAREQEVLQLVAQGRSNKAIGRQLFLSASTVNYHLTSVFNKLGVSTRAQAVAVAAQRGRL